MKITMTRVMSVLAVLLLAEVAVWAVIGFLFWNWDIATYDAEARFGFVISALMVPVPVLVVVNEFLRWVEFND